MSVPISAGIYSCQCGCTQCAKSGKTLGGGRGRGAEGGGGAGGREGRVGQRGQAGGREGGREGWSRGGRRKFYLRAELIKCIDPNEGEALKRGVGRGGWGGGQAGGGREGWGRGGQKEILPEGGIDQMY